MHGHGHGSSLTSLDAPKGAGVAAPVYRALFHFNNSDVDAKGCYGWASKSQAGSYSTTRQLGSHSLKGVFNWLFDGKPLDVNSKVCGVAGFVRFGGSGGSVYVAPHEVYSDGTHYAYCRVIAYNTTTIRFMLSNRTDLLDADDINLDVTVSASTNTWFWFAIVYNGTTVECYLDDAKVAEYTLSGTTQWYDTPNPFIQATTVSGYLDELVYFEGSTPPSRPSVEMTP